MSFDCFECGARIEGAALDDLGASFLRHARGKHDWPFPDQAIRNYAEATQRLTGSAERLPAIGEVVVRPVTEDRLDDWLGFFDHDAYVGKPEWAACYCLEPHVRRPGPADGGTDDRTPSWRENRDAMLARLRDGASFGYLAYVEGRPAGWVNASRRSDYTLHPVVDGPPGDEVAGVACFVIAPPYRRHGIAAALLDEVIADAPRRGARWVEAYPFREAPESDAGNFRGPRSLYDSRGFEQVEERERDVVMRRPL